MIETKVPKDIRAYDIRVAGPLTLRQLVLLITSFTLDLFLYNSVMELLHVSSEIRLYVIIFLDIPIMMLSAKPMGIKMEKYLYAVIRSNFLAPQKRRAVNRILKPKPFGYTAKELKRERKLLKKVLREHPEYKVYK